MVFKGVLPVLDSINARGVHDNVWDVSIGDYYFWMEVIDPHRGRREDIPTTNVEVPRCI